MINAELTITQLQVAADIQSALELIPPNDRLGFLFGIIINTMRMAGQTEIEIRTEVHKGLDLALALSRPRNAPGS